MTPEQLAALGAVATILKTVGTLPIGLILMMVFVGPWVGMMVATGSISKQAAKEAQRVNEAIVTQNQRVNDVMIDFRDQVSRLVSAQERRFEAVVRMYENNVQVVKDYHSLTSDLTGIITLSTRTLEGLVQKIDNNQFCPLARNGVGKS